MTARKNPHAVAIGRRGGKANTPAQLAARRKNAKKGGRKQDYEVREHEPGRLQLTRRAGDHWLPVTQFTPARLIYVANWLRLHKPRTAVTAINAVAIDYAKARKE